MGAKTLNLGLMLLLGLVAHANGAKAAPYSQAGAVSLTQLGT
jgi:hypothetical protein